MSPSATRRCRRGRFFFQAEAGIRDYKVTGVQTCALPISPIHVAGREFCVRPSIGIAIGDCSVELLKQADAAMYRAKAESGSDYAFYDDELRSEERRVGKECRSRWSPYH